MQQVAQDFRNSSKPDTIGDMEELTPRQRGVIKAAETNRRKKEERLARELRARGWVVHSPYPGEELPDRKYEPPKRTPIVGQLTEADFCPPEVIEAMQAAYAKLRKDR